MCGCGFQDLSDVSTLSAFTLRQDISVCCRPRVFSAKPLLVLLNQYLTIKVSLMEVKILRI